MSTVAMTCNRLSSFLKDKGTLRDIRINAVNGKPESSSPVSETNKTTVDLLSKIESPINTSEKTEKSINHLPQYVTVDSFCKPHGSSNKVVSGEVVEPTEAKPAQMTIIYRGQVLVFDCVSADKARDIMLAAGAFFDHQSQKRIPPSEAFGSQCRILSELQINESDLPIARRSSLHKFLSKRKDRATESAPYRLPNRLMVAPSLLHNFDLNL